MRGVIGPMLSAILLGACAVGTLSAATIPWAAKGFIVLVSAVMGAAIHRAAARAPSPAIVAFGATGGFVAFGGPLLFVLTLVVASILARPPSHPLDALLGAVFASFASMTCGLLFSVPLALVVGALHAGVVWLIARKPKE